MGRRRGPFLGSESDRRLGYIRKQPTKMRNIKEFKDWSLNENQKFNFDGYKRSILAFIETIKRNEPGVSPWPFAYGLIRGESKVGAANSLGFTDDQKRRWKDKLTQNPWTTDGGPWSQINHNPQLKRREGDKTLNYYITLAKTKENLNKFALSFGDLHTLLQSLSDQTSSPISWKTHNNLDALAGDNDSLKIFYYDRDLKQAVEEAVEEWKAKTGVQTSTRTHSHGVDASPSPGEGKKSWGQILADGFEEELTKLVKKHGNQYTDEEYYEWVKKALPLFLSKSGVSYRN